MEIHAPKLPPMRGYIEVEVDGKREYRGPVKASAADTGPDAVSLLKAQTAMLEAQQTFLEDCLLEMADEVYA